MAGRYGVYVVRQGALELAERADTEAQARAIADAEILLAERSGNPPVIAVYEVVEAGILPDGEDQFIPMRLICTPNA